MSNNVSTLQSFLALGFSGQLDKAVKLLHPNVVFHEADSLPYGGDFHGPEGFLQLLMKLGGAYELKVYETQFIKIGENAVICRMRAKCSSFVATNTVDMSIVEFYTFTDGLISDVDIFYKDTMILANLAKAAQ